MILVIDNYDSFVYNLVQYIGELAPREPGGIKVFRNDKISVDRAVRLRPRLLVISPGPCTPREAGISVKLIRKLAGRVPILGVCLGHQCIGEAFGGKIIRAGRIMHGKTSRIKHDGKSVFRGLSNPFTATRYHSLVIEKRSMPKSLAVTAASEDGEIMGVRHKTLPVEGVQFHPESILTSQGKRLLQNFIKSGV